LGKPDSKKRRGLSGHLLNVALFAVLAYAVVRPGGPLDTNLAERAEQRHFEKLAQEHWNVLAATSARLGGGEDSSLPIIVEFGDYECPFCRRSYLQMQRVLARYPDVTVGFRHYPLDRIHGRAETAARAAICAEVQGQFQAMHSVLLESNDWRDLNDWTALAEQVGILDLGEYERCLTGRMVEEKLAEDRRLAELLEVTGTPTYFYKYGARVGYLDEDQLIELVENAR
jgi:protein-disulfide isomerase